MDSRDCNKYQYKKTEGSSRRTQTTRKTKKSCTIKDYARSPRHDRVNLYQQQRKASKNRVTKTSNINLQSI